MAIFDLNYALMQWQSIGIFDIMLPFMLLFAIFYAIFQKTKLFGAKPGIDAIVSMAIAFMAIINPFVNEIIKIVLQNMVIAILVIVAMMLMFGLLLGPKKPKSWIFFAGIVGIMALVWLLGRVADYYEMYYPGTAIFSTMWWNNNLPWIIPILIILIFAVVVISSGSEKKTGEKTFGNQFMKLMTEKSEDEW